ncbi:ABC transporter permease [Bradyrhizobium tropiciagri]|uniref:ABC transporter permease n=1 Tax=Bradyrhizobium tropiciagri TaxID=312253 RepID=UPI001BA5A5BE|nr:ABC transporter permease [Bradyrhizobium tropiciagri]MBR0896735.1 ABC transporter permease [Bradyrhizobium tropiciagri]
MTDAVEFSSIKSRSPGAVARVLGSSLGLFVLTSIALVAAWQLIVVWFEVPQFILPAPSEVVRAIYSDLVTGRIVQHFLVTLVEIVGGFVVAAILGVALGSLIGLVPIAERIGLPYLLAFQTVPKVAIAPLLIVWFGYGIQSKIVTAGLIAFFPILVNVVTGLQTVDQRRIVLMQSLKASPLEIYCKVLFPGMLPYLFAGLETGAVFSAIGAIVAEFIGAAFGLGCLILQRQAAVDVPGVFSALIFLSLIGIMLNLLVRLAARRLTFWSRPRRTADH